MMPCNRRLLLRRTGRICLIGMGYSAFSLLNQGCITVGGNSSLSELSSYANLATTVFKAGSKALEDITPEQEYYIGRTIGAIILSKYKPYRNQAANHYVNVLGQTLAQFSETPRLYDGYHLQILDSETINAFATPSGLIFITRGMIRCCANEGDLAAVLAHEIGHIQAKHGLQAIEKGRITQALTTIAIEGTKQFGDEDVAKLTNLFEESIDDIVTTMVNNGYSRSSEEEADQHAVKILQRTGYTPSCLVNMLEIMEQKLQPGGLDFAATHPSPQSRIATLAPTLDTPYVEVHPRQQRFAAAVRGV